MKMIENTTTGSGHHHGYRLNISIPYVLEIFSREGLHARWHPQSRGKRD